MTAKQYKELLEMVDPVIKMYPEWRRGQAVFNIMVDLYPEDAEEIRGTSLDMFHWDDNIEKYKDML